MVLLSRSTIVDLNFNLRSILRAVLIRTCIVTRDGFLHVMLFYNIDIIDIIAQVNCDRNRVSTWSNLRLYDIIDVYPVFPLFYLDYKSFLSLHFLYFTLIINPSFCTNRQLQHSLYMAQFAIVWYH